MPVLSEEQQAEAEASIDAGLDLVARVHRILNLEGHHDMSLGHLSWRDPLGRGLWLKRARLGIEEVTADDFILIDFDGRVLVGCAVHRHLEWPIHTELMKRRPEIVAVAHTHPRYATLFSCTREPLRPLTNEGVWFEKPPPFFTETSDLVDTVALGRAHAAAMDGHDALFLRNHGVSFVGRSIQELCLTGIFLEKACRAQITLAQSGLPYSWPEAEEVARKRANIYPPRARDNFFGYYDRLLTRIEQG
ncbi:MAG: class II aldolase/adducin family protein [Azospirillaceae bacterium]